MCEPTTIFLGLSLALGVASTVSSAVIADKQADSYEKNAKAQFKLEKEQADAAAQQAAEAATQERAALAEEAARARGVAKTAGLGESSLRSFLLDISRREGRSNAVIDRNLELVSAQQRALTAGAQLGFDSKLIDIDSVRPNAAVMGLQLGSNVASSYVDYKVANREPKPGTLTRTGTYANADRLA